MKANASGTHQAAKLAPRRRSWQDLVDASGELTPSELSVPVNDAAGGASVSSSMGNRRGSWLELVDSDENLHRHHLVSARPNGEASGLPVVSMRERHIPSVRLHAKTDRSRSIESGSLTWEEFPSLSKSGQSGTTSRSSPFMKSESKTNYRCSKRRGLMLLGLVLGVFLLAAVAGVVARRYANIPRVFRYVLVGTGGGLWTVTVRDSVISFLVVGAQDMLPNVQARADLEHKFLLYHDSRFVDYCFVFHMNETMFRDATQIEKAGENAVKAVHSTLLDNTWQWYPQPVKEGLRDYFLSGSKLSCKPEQLYYVEHKNIHYFKSVPCAGCTQVCLPNFGTKHIINANGVSEEVLLILDKSCFWLFMPAPTISSTTPLVQTHTVV